MLPRLTEEASKYDIRLAWGFGNRNMKEYLEALQRHNYTGYLGQELTDGDYFDNPADIDRKNMVAYEPFIR